MCLVKRSTYYVASLNYLKCKDKEYNRAACLSRPENLKLLVRLKANLHLFSLFFQGLLFHFIAFTIDETAK